MNYPLTLLRSELYGVLAVNLIALRMAKTLSSFLAVLNAKGVIVLVTPSYLEHCISFCSMKLSHHSMLTY